MVGWVVSAKFCIPMLPKLILKKSNSVSSTIVTSTMLERPQVDSDILVERFGDSMTAMIVLNQDNRSRSREISDLTSDNFC